ncbi:MAG: hypothetical protein IE927_10985, partial [Rhodobacterales bacterium]|nr:hypothetical protein [Rhodobacterales bacterium]
ALVPSEAAAPRPGPVEARLRAVHPDDLSPREALALVYELRALLAAGEAPDVAG